MSDCKAVGMQVAVVYRTRQCCASGTTRRPHRVHRRDTPDVASADQPYVITNDDPLNSPDPLGEDDQGFMELRLAMQALLAGLLDSLTSAD